MVLADAGMGITDEAHPPRGKIGQTAEPVRNRQGLRVGIQRIDGEIAPCRILAPVIGKGDGGAAAIGGDIAAQRGDFHRTTGQHGGDGVTHRAAHIAGIASPQRRHQRRQILAPGPGRLGQHFSHASAACRPGR